MQSSDSNDKLLGAYKPATILSIRKVAGNEWKLTYSTRLVDFIRNAEYAKELSEKYGVKIT